MKKKRQELSTFSIVLLSYAIWIIVVSVYDAVTNPYFPITIHVFLPRYMFLFAATGIILKNNWLKGIAITFIAEYLFNPIKLYEYALPKGALVAMIMALAYRDPISAGISFFKSIPILILLTYIIIIFFIENKIMDLIFSIAFLFFALPLESGFTWALITGTMYIWGFLKSMILITIYFIIFGVFFFLSKRK